MQTIIITGGTGLVGSYLSKKLLDNGYNVGILSRRKKNIKNIQAYFWDVNNNEIDETALKTADFIVHLAGENIGEKRWTKKRKQQILDSRVKSANLIFEKLKKNNYKPKAIISASAVGYYGAINSDKTFVENDEAAKDFLGETCKQWEAAINQFNSLQIRTAILRTGVVLTENEGIISKLKPIVKYGLGSAIGNGKQYMPWIHIDDLCEIYLKAIQDNTINGAYNAVASEHISNKEFTKTFAKILHKPFWFPSVPSLAMKIIFGEMANILLKGVKVSNKKIIEKGFQFKFPSLISALENILKK